VSTWGAGGGRGARSRWAGPRSPPCRTGSGFGTLSLANGALIVLAAAVLQGIFHTAQKPLLARYTGFEVTAYAM
jgi:hypothetical protein